MKLWRTWLGCLGFAGACMLVAGCGSDTPDPSSDPQASAAPAPGGEGGAAPIGPQAAAEDGAAAQAAAPAPAPPAKAPNSSTTADMLAMAGGASPPPAGGGAPAAGSPPSAGAPAAPAAGAPAAAPPTAGAPGGMGMGRMGPMAPQTGPNMQDMQKAMQQSQANMMRMQQQAGAQSGARQQAGMPAAGAGAGGGAAGADLEPADFHTPEGAVRGFLSALKAKDLDRLNESTALRAQSEASSSRNRDLFKKIFELALSDSDLDDLGKKLEGYQIAGENPPQSTGKVGVIIRKAGKNGGYLTRLVTVRHEKKGWGVFDIGAETEFKSINRMPNRNTNNRR
jgi:hypothetical protein